MRSLPPDVVVSTLKDEFNIEMDIYTAVRHSAKALELMGMLALHKEISQGLVQNYCYKMPPEVVKISSVICTSKPIDVNWKYEIQDIYHPPQIVFRSSDTSDAEHDVTETPQYINNFVPSQHHGYIDFVWECPYLKFNDTDVEICVEYSTLSLDKNGYPRIPETAIDGCVHWALFKYMQPLYLVGKVGEAQMERVTQWKNQKINQSKTATIMRGLSNNEKNRVLNIMSSFDRKRVNIDA